MISKLHFPTLLILAVFAMTSQTSLSYGQAPEDAAMFGKPTPDKIVVVRLSHANAHAVASAITALEGQVRAAAVHPNSVVLRGPKERVQAILEHVIAELDTPREEATTSMIAHFTPIAPEAVDVVRELAHAVITSEDTRIAFDDQQGMVVVRGPDRDVAAIQALVSQIDGARAPLNVTFFFLRGKFGGHVSNAAPNVPSPLMPVIQPLMENGLNDVYLMAPVWVRADQDKDFEAKAFLENAVKKPGDSSENLHFIVRGRVQMPPQGETVHLEILAAVEGDHTMPGGTHGDTTFKVSTTITTDLGDYVILALAPSSTAEGNAIALVVRVTPG